MGVCLFGSLVLHLALFDMEGSSDLRVTALCQELTELILALLPLRSILVSSAVCKHWRSTLSAAEFAVVHSRLSGRKPLFFFCGMNFRFPAKNQVFSFDPVAGSWIRLALLSPPELQQRRCLAGMNGLAFGVTGLNQSRLCYASCLVKPTWNRTPFMNYARSDPLVAVVGDASSESHRIFVVGGVEDGDHFSAEVYDAVSNQWELFPSLPSSFGKIYFSSWMSCVVHEGKVYVYKNITGAVCALDLDHRIWLPTGVLRPQGVSYSFLLGCEGILVLAGLYGDDKELSFRLWEVEVATMACKEIGRMPSHIFSFFMNENDDKNVPLKCVARGRVIYMYSDSMFKDYVTCMCEISPSGCSWSMLPPLPSPLNRFDRVICLTTTVSIEACFSRYDNGWKNLCRK